MVVTATIINVSYPKIGKPGDVLDIKVSAKQVSDWASDILHADTFRLYFKVDGVQIAEKAIALPNNVEITSSYQYRMPDKNVNMVIELWFTELAFISWVIKDSTTIFIQKGTYTSTPEDKPLYKQSLIDIVFGDIKYVIIVLVIIVLLLFLIQVRRK